MQENSKLGAVEGIRGLACFVVVISHMSLTFYPLMHNFGDSVLSPTLNKIEYYTYHSPFGFIFSGSMAVSVFFVLSGYILSHVCLKREYTKARFLKSVVKRYPRLMLPSLVSCILFFMCLSLFSVDISNVPFWISRYSDIDLNISDALFDGLLGAFYGEGSTYNWVLWTMEVELIGSFLIFFICFVCNRLGFYSSAFVSFVVVISSVFAVLLFGESPAVGLGYISFIFGYFIYTCGKKLGDRYSFVILFLGLYLAGAHNYSDSYLWLGVFLGKSIYVLCNFTAGLLIVYAVIMNSKLSALFSRRLFVWMGTVSFSVYLLHLLFLYFVAVPFHNLFLALKFDYGMSVVFSVVLMLIPLYLSASMYYGVIDKASVWFSSLVSDKLSVLWSGVYLHSFKLFK